LERAGQYYGQSLELCERRGDEWEIVHVRHRVAAAACELGHWDRARELAEENLRRARAGGWRMLETEALSLLGNIEDQDGNFEQAVELTRRCLELTRDLGFEWFEAIALVNLGEYELKLGRRDEAERHASAALELARRLNDRQTVVFALALVALVARARGDDDLAGRIWGAIDAESARAAIGRWESVYRREYEQRIVGGAGPAFERGLEAGRGISLEALAKLVLGAGETEWS
jgi:tetratricopeptide (TPR) repeat protein